MSTLDLNIIDLFHGDTPVLKVMKGDVQKWPLLPYDAEVEYLQSIPVAKIDTGVSDIDAIEIKFRVSSFTAYSAIFGNYVSESANVWRLIMSSSSSSQDMLLYVGSKASAYTSVPIGARNVVHTLFASKSSVIADGVTVTNINTTSGSANNTNIVLFAANVNSTSQSDLQNKIYYFKAWKNGVLLRDFIPVRVGQVGYMYDKVSGELFGNDGTGDFTIGPDK